jgi:hypothetical protein
VFYTYAHYTSDGRLFYIGKGHGRRAYCFHKRNNYWNNIVAKHGKPVVKIIAEWIIEAEALAHEIELIKQYRIQGIELCNLTDGGDGTSGRKHSEEFKARISALHKGNKWRLGLPTSTKQKSIASIVSKGNRHAAGNTNNRTWIWIGTNILTGEVVKYIGEKEMKSAGLQHANIIKCLNGERKSHKGYTWHREAWSNA